ncbi:MAG TPA: HD domain-containing protein [Terriglobales bacterium]|nr:HD domain-containing protein [Terriglobales bacterium]
MREERTPGAGNRAFSERFGAALAYAADLHRLQTRKGKANIPYVGHLLGVASLVIEAGGDEEMAIAALLHDAVEDQGGRPRLEEIRDRFGARVAHIVEGCTDSDQTPKPPWLERKRQYIEHVRQVADSEVCFVSAADKLHNARTILTDFRRLGDKVWERFSGKKDGTLWYYRTIVNAFREAQNRRAPDRALAAGYSRIVDELEGVVSKLEQLSGGQGEVARVTTD